MWGGGKLSNDTQNALKSARMFTNNTYMSLFDTAKVITNTFFELHITFFELQKRNRPIRRTKRRQGSTWLPPPPYKYGAFNPNMIRVEFIDKEIIHSWLNCSPDREVSFSLAFSHIAALNLDVRVYLVNGFQV